MGARSEFAKFVVGTPALPPAGSMVYWFDIAGEPKKMDEFGVITNLTVSAGGVTSVNGFVGVVTLTKTNIGLSNADNTSDANKPVSTAQATALGLKADLASPALTGVPTAPTAIAGTNTTQLATTAFVLTEIGAIPPGATVNPTSGVIPINNAGAFVDSSISENVLSGVNIVNAAGIVLNAPVINIPSLTPSTVVTVDAFGNLLSSAVTLVELAYLSGVTSGVQTQLDSKWSTTGNAGLTDGVDNFIGTNTNVPLNFLVNGITAGRIDSGSGNVYLGYQAGELSAGGTANTLIGQQAGQNNITGSNITAIGFQALQSNTVGDSTAIGHLALKNNTTGLSNTGVGNLVLTSNVTGAQNSGFGDHALWQNLVDNNTAFGYYSLQANVNGTQSVAVGVSTLYNSNADNNTAVGYAAATSNTTGTGLVAIGANALSLSVTADGSVGIGFNALHNSNGIGNVGIGRNSGYNTTTGTYNTYVGDSTGQGIIGGSNNTIIGANVSGLVAGLSDNIILASGSGTVGLQIDVVGSARFYNGLQLPVILTTVAYLITALDSNIICTANSFNVTLPSAVGILGRIYTIKNNGGVADVITLDTSLAEFIDGVPTQTLAQYVSYTVISNGVDWSII